MYSLAVTLYEMLTGRAPFSGENLPQLCTAILAGQVTRADAQPPVPAALMHVVARAMHVDRARRYPSMSDFAGALAPWVPIRSRYIVDSLERMGAARSSTEPPPPDGALARFDMVGAQTLDAVAETRLAHPSRDPASETMPGTTTGAGRARAQRKSAALVGIGAAAALAVGVTVMLRSGAGAETPAPSGLVAGSEPSAPAAPAAPQPVETAAPAGSIAALEVHPSAAPTATAAPSSAPTARPAVARPPTAGVAKPLPKPPVAPNAEPAPATPAKPGAFDTRD